ncbi:hypothetical protein C2W64_03105 [Brevibacillus laterosporus]|nr:hypothetical protein C2W64_03105 [Brevibacillus laterosporus]
MYPITEVCMVLGVSRSGYYKYLSTRNLHRDKSMKKRIRTIEPST